MRQISVLAHHGDPFSRACLVHMPTAVSSPPQALQVARDADRICNSPHTASFCSDVICMVSGAGLGGGALVRQISVLAHHGDPFLRACLGRMLTAVSAPLVEMVRAWLFDGRLDMPPGEFFICQSPTAPGTLQAPSPPPF